MCLFKHLKIFLKIKNFYLGQKFNMFSFDQLIFKFHNEINFTYETL